MARCLVGLGSNLGDRESNLRAAFDQIAKLPHTSLAAQSGHYSSPPCGGPADQGEFLNAAAVLESTLRPQTLLASLREIENSLQRTRQVRWGPRSIDLDLLLYDELVLSTPDLTLPHPRMSFRRFVLAPAREVAAEMRHPEIGWTIDELWEHLNSAPNYVALEGGTAEFRRALAQRAAAASGARAILFPADWRTLGAGSVELHAEAEPQAATWHDLFPTRETLGSSAAISDFWLEGWLARTSGSATSAESQELAADLCFLRAHVLAPKLLVRLDDAPCPAPFSGPVLRITPDSLDGAAAEVSAAIAAMR